MNDYKKFVELINLFKSHHFSIKEEKETNIFDITGYPHYENVASNILKFFFDTNEVHGYRDLWLRSLLDVYNSKTIEPVNISMLETRNIEREYSNGSDKRIDLLIDANPLIVVIENKIYASVYNPFAIYTKMAINYVKDKQLENYRLVKIVLSLNKEEIDKETGFINITYDELFDKLDELSPNYEPIDKWKMFATEFIDNLRRKKEDTNMKMDQEWIDFVDQGNKDLSDLYKQLEDSINQRVSIFRDINDNLNDLPFRKGVYNAKAETYVSQYNDIPINKDGVNICVEAYMMKYATKEVYEDYDKLYISLWCRKNRHYDFSEILKALDKENADMRVTDGTGAWGKHYILDVYTLTEAFNIDEISSRIRKYIETIDALNKE